MSSRYTREPQVERREIWRRQNKRVVFTMGCYDTPHRAPVRQTELSHTSGSSLILASNPSTSVSRIKWLTLPPFSELKRANTILALEAAHLGASSLDTSQELMSAVLPVLQLHAANQARYLAMQRQLEDAGADVLSLPLPRFSNKDIAAQILLLQAELAASWK